MNYRALETWADKAAQELQDLAGDLEDSGSDASAVRVLIDEYEAICQGRPIHGSPTLDMQAKAHGVKPMESALALAIDRAGMTAAWYELQPLKNDELPTPKKVLACLRAFRAASDAADKARKALKAAYPEAKHIWHSPEPTDMVCSALMGLDMESENIHPRSMLGARISALFQAAKALEAMSTVYSAFDDDDEIFGTYLADETTMLAEAEIRGRHEDA